MRLIWVALAACLALGGHVGVNDVFFEGLAGPYPLYVTIRPPVVIPGVAEISIRSAAKDVRRIRITPMALTGAGSKYPPTPDQAVQSKDDPQTFTGGLWIMSPGSWQVKASLEGDRGPATLSVPVRAASQKVTTMDARTGAILLVLMLVLAAGVVGIAGAAVREAQLPAGVQMDGKGLQLGRVAMGVGVGVSVLIIWLGGNWWDSESQAYARSIYKPIEMKAMIEGDRLELRLTASGWMQPKAIDDFIPDHGHLMHLYVIADPAQDVAFHLHPRRMESGKFAVKLPEMPTGNYRLFADIVHESGFPETLTAGMRVAIPPVGGFSSMEDAGGSLSMGAKLAGGGQVVLASEKQWKAGQAVTLRFRVLDPEGNPAANLKPYLGMAAHLAIVKQDFQVFSHIHPNGNISMAAFEMAQNNDLRLNDNVLISSHAKGGTVEVVPSEFSFPFGFPQSGNYLLILQFARQDRVETAAFTIAVDK